jgi:hypothetical protein
MEFDTNIDYEHTNSVPNNGDKSTNKNTVLSELFNLQQVISRYWNLLCTALS